MPRFRWEPDNQEDLEALVASAVAERRPLQLQVEVLMKRALAATPPASPPPPADPGRTPTGVRPNRDAVARCARTAP